MKPSNTIGMRNAAAPKIIPVMAPISKPPILARTSRASWTSGLICFQTSLDGGNFSFQSCIVDSRAPADHIGRGSAGDCAKNGRGAAGIADSHIAGAQNKDIFPGDFAGELNPNSSARSASS